VSGKTAFLDTNLFIYLIEENPRYLGQVHKVLDHLDAQGYEVITSTLTLGEILTRPYMENRYDLVEEYERFFSRISLIELNSTIASLFAKYRAKYRVKTPDAVQLASAVYAGADWFVSNDEQLGGFDEEGCRTLLLSTF
jgi:predicted nucleic acid-binding protein